MVIFSGFINKKFWFDKFCNYVLNCDSDTTKKLGLKDLKAKKNTDIKKNAENKKANKMVC